MPFEVPLPPAVKTQGWKIKIFDRERLEPPHVTILCGLRKWRVGLRDREFLVPPGGSWREIHALVRHAVEASWDVLVEAWDAKYPENPVRGTDDD